MFGPHPHLFNFELRPLEQIGRNPVWYWLSDGRYWIAAGGATLYEMTPQRLAYYRAQGDSEASPFAEYPVGRLHEDLLQILPAVAEPIPASVFERFSEPGTLIARFAEFAGEKSELDGLREAACRWWWDRYLTAWHLKAGPEIQFRREGEEAVLAWDDSARNEADGLPAWTSPAGEFRLSWGLFWGEVEDFHARFMRAMAERIAEARAKWPAESLGPDGRANLDYLLTEQAKREQSLAEAMAKPRTPTDWPAVLAAMERAEAMLAE